MATWRYDACPHGIGKLCSASAPFYTREHSYDSLGRPAAVQVTIHDATYTTTATYDALGRLDTTTTPDGVIEMLLHFADVSGQHYCFESLAVGRQRLRYTVLSVRIWHGARSRRDKITAKSISIGDPTVIVS